MSPTIRQSSSNVYSRLVHGYDMAFAPCRRRSECIEQAIHIGTIGRRSPEDPSSTGGLRPVQLLDAVHQPLVDAVGLLAGEEHRGYLHERVLGALDYLHVVQGVEPPPLGGLLQSDLHVEVVGRQDDRLERLHAEALRGHDPVVAVHQQVAVPPLYDDQRLVEAPLELVLAADELVHVDLLLSGDDHVDGDLPVDNLHMDAVLLLHEVLDGHHLPGAGLLDLGADDIDVGYDPDQLLVLIHHGKVPETVAEQDAGGVVDAHGRYGAEGAALHDGADLRLRTVYVAEKLLRGDESEEVALLGYGEPVEGGLDDLLPHLLDGHVWSDRVDVADHVLADCRFRHMIPERRSADIYESADGTDAPKGRSAESHFLRVESA